MFDALKKLFIKPLNPEIPKGNFIAIAGTKCPLCSVDGIFSELYDAEDPETAYMCQNCCWLFDKGMNPLRCIKEP